MSASLERHSFTHELYGFFGAHHHITKSVSLWEDDRYHPCNHVPARRNVRGRPMRRDREGKFDLADIGGETRSAAHNPNIGSPDRQPREWTRCGRRGIVIHIS
jgi:hypothetical protein